MTFTSDQLRQIFIILVEECDALPNECEAFIYHISRDCQEYRCCHALGFGGKFYSDTCNVDYYIEDKTPEKEKIRKKTNEKLQELIQTFDEATENAK